MPMRWYLSNEFFKSDYFGQDVRPPPPRAVRPLKNIYLPLVVLGCP